MERNIVIEKGRYVPVKDREVELVERKGIGHPDSLIDGIMEEISKELSKAYLEEFGKILHHNVDKGQICGGGTRVEFGGGSFTKPIYILLTGRATEEAEGKTIPVQHIAQSTAHNYLKKAVPPLDVCCDVEIESRISAGSADLVELFLRGPKIPYANDTSFGTGFAPFTDLEKIVLAAETHLNSPEYKAVHPEVGTDIKVMGLREGNKIRLTIACAFVSRHIQSMDQYVECRERVRQDAIATAKKITDMEVDVFVNTGDSVENNSVYITLTGTSAEMGDDGSVGRGNRVNGLITPFRSMTLEAAAGKNPVNHVGKIYSVLATEMASSISKEHPELEDITITLLSQIGKPIDQPKVASVNLICGESDFERLRTTIRRDVDSRLENITEITNQIVHSKVPLF
ncbi:methionine adenosyltransferase [Candidatus Micrarchaeota archaeon]|nr:methionine adenosyltransferase [Candidatus Micrarchaeota archaeon]